MLLGIVPVKWGPLLMYCLYISSVYSESLSSREDFFLCEICETMVKEVTGLLESNKTEVCEWWAWYPFLGFGWDGAVLTGEGKLILLPVFTTARFLSWVGQKRCAYELSQISLPHLLLLPCVSGGDCAWDGGGLPPVPGKCQGPVQGLHRGLWPGCDWHALGGNKSWSCVHHAEMLCSQQASPAARWSDEGSVVFKMSWFSCNEISLEDTADTASFFLFGGNYPSADVWFVFYFSQL